MNVLPDHEDVIAQTDDQTALDNDNQVKWRVYAASRQRFEDDALRPALDDGDNAVAARAFGRQKTAVVFQTVDEMVDAFRRLRDWAADTEDDDDVDGNVIKKAKSVAAGLKLDLQDMGVDVDDFDVASPQDDAADSVDADAADDAQADAQGDGSDAPDDDQDSDADTDSDASDDADQSGLTPVREQAGTAGLVEALTPSQLRDYRATILGDADYAEQAQEVGVMPHTVRSNISRARQAIRDAGLDVDGDPEV